MGEPWLSLSLVDVPLGVPRCSVDPQRACGVCPLLAECKLRHTTFGCIDRSLGGPIQRARWERAAGPSSARSSRVGVR
jgi:hypothetical protein